MAVAGGPLLAPAPRNPRPESRLDVLGVLAATAVAAVAYLAGSALQVFPSHGFAVVLLTTAPVCAVGAWILVRHQARLARDGALAWFSAGVGVAIVAMVLQLISFPAVAAGGGLLGTRSGSSVVLYLIFHLAPAGGALAGALGAPQRWRRPSVGIGVLLAIFAALNVVGIPLVIRADGSYTARLVVIELVTATLIAGVVAFWVWRLGRSTSLVRALVAVALSLAAYDVLLNALAVKRFGPIWWSSLSMRVATWSVLAAGALIATLRAMQRLERYTDEELTRREGELRVSLTATEQLLTIAGELSRALTIDDVGQVLVSSAMTIPGVDHAGIAVVDETESTLQLLASMDYDEATRDRLSRLPLDSPLPAAEVIRTGTPVFIATGQQVRAVYPSLGELPAHREAESLAVVPLALAGLTVGALTVLGDRPHAWSALDRELLAAICAQGAQAMQRARLYERERRTAEVLQNSLLPQDLPRLGNVDVAARYLPGSLGLAIGGDWYDCMALDDGRLVLVVGDVMGKGLRAATLMGQVRNAVRAFATIDPSPTTVLSRLDRLTHELAIDEIVTLVYALVDPAAGTLRVARAGHLPPLHVTIGGRAMLLEEGESPPMGVPVAERGEATVTVSPGDLLVLYSDGLVEDRRTGLDVGLPLLMSVGQRLSRVEASAAAVIDELLEAADAVAGRSDDVTVLALRLGQAPGPVTVGPPPAAPAQQVAAGSSLTWRADAVFPSQARSVAVARQLVRDTLSRQQPVLSAETIDTTLLLVSELVTNAVLHGQGEVTLRLHRRDDVLRIEVHDEGPADIAPRDVDPLATGGRGLALVAACASDWGVEANHGKTVWCELSLGD